MDEINIKNLTFSKKPISVPVDYRPAYKIALICLILRFSCIGDKSSLLKLHLISWSLKSRENKKQLLKFIQNNKSKEISVWGIEPALNRALQLAVADSFFSYKSSSYKLEKKGAQLLKKIIDSGDIFLEEIEFLKNIGKKSLTEKSIQELTNKWRLFND